jgi:hypothetical protein
VRKTAPKSVGRPFAEGDDPRRGGGKKGRSGRKSRDFYLQCQEATDAYVLPKCVEVVQTRSPVGTKGQPDGAYWAAANFLAKYARSPAMPSMQLSQESGKVTVTLDLGET